MSFGFFAITGKHIARAKQILLMAAQHGGVDIETPTFFNDFFQAKKRSHTAIWVELFGQQGELEGVGRGQRMAFDPRLHQAQKCISMQKKVQLHSILQFQFQGLEGSMGGIHAFHLFSKKETGPEQGQQQEWQNDLEPRLAPSFKALLSPTMGYLFYEIEHTLMLSPEDNIFKTEKDPGLLFLP